MKVRSGYAVVLGSISVAALFACGGSSSQGDAQSGGTGPTGQTMVGAGGGSLSTPSGGLTMEVPSGAVEEDTQFTAEDVTEPGVPRKLLDIDGTELGEATPIGDVVYKLGPDNVTFPSRVNIEVPVTPTNNPDEYFLLTRQSAGDPEPVPIAIASSRSKSIKATATHFSTFRKSVLRLRSDVCGGVVIERNSKGCVVRPNPPFLIHVKQHTGKELVLDLLLADQSVFRAVDPPSGKPNVTGLCEAVVKTVGCKRLPGLLGREEEPVE